jgi:hypothetical protein
MSRAALATLAAAAVLTGCGAAAGATSGAGGAASRRVAVPGRISVAVPAGWHLRRPPITALGAPVERFLVTSGPAPRGGNCSPEAAERALPPHGALLFLFEYTGRDAARRAGFPPKPAHARLPRRDLATYECWRVPSYALRFRAAGRAFQLHVAFGPRAGARRRAQVLRTIDSLWISPHLPPGHGPGAGARPAHQPAPGGERGVLPPRHPDRTPPRPPVLRAHAPRAVQLLHRGPRRARRAVRRPGPAQPLLLRRGPAQPPRRHGLRHSGRPRSSSYVCATRSAPKLRWGVFSMSRKPRDR